MSRTSPHHHSLTNGEGKCSVPMFSGHGMDAGFCDKPAYGQPPQSRMWFNHAAGRMMREDLRYEGHVPGLACHAHGGPSLDELAPPGGKVYRDGSAWCAVGPGFVNLQESDAGFGDTPAEAVAALTATPHPTTPTEPSE